jgi:hypothetical protein
MAKAIQTEKIIEVEQVVKTQKIVKEITLTLSEEEAQFIYGLVAKIGGGSSLRKYSNAIYNTLHEICKGNGVDVYYGVFEKYIPSITLNQSEPH